MAADDDTLLTLIGEIHGALDLDELVDVLLRALPEAVPSDYISINDVGPDPDGVVAVIVPEQPLHLHQAFARHAHENPIAAHYAATHEGRPLRLSDVTTPEELQKTNLYREVYAPLRVGYQIAFTLPASPGRILAIAMSRHDYDYSDAERDFLARARPFLIQAWRNAIQHTALRDDLRGRPFEDGAPSGAMIGALCERGLTARQAEVLWLVSRGRSNADAAAVLGLSERTVQKHLERSYRALEVSSRSEAAAIVWSLVPAEPPTQAPRRIRLEEPT